MIVDEQQILYSSDKAAKFVTGIEGWVDSHGRFFGKDEHLARYSGCTHVECNDCGKPTVVRSYTICDECRSKKEIEKYNSKPILKWDRTTPLYSDSVDEYFFNEEDLHEYIEDHETTIKALRLIVCEPNEFREIDGEYFCDELPEDGELPASLEEAMEKFNQAIKAQLPASWSPGKYAADIIE